MGSGPPSRNDAQAGQARLNKRIVSLQEKGIISTDRPESMNKLIELILPAYFSDPEFPVPADLKNTDFNAAVYQKTMAAVGDWDLSTDVAELTHPVLMLWGEDDPFGLPMAEAIKKALPRTEMEFVVLEGCGHYWHERETMFFSHVRTFLKSLSEPSRRQ
jgi:pimeloyl-ACP methyl ester carboxylesterase